MKLLGHEFTFAFHLDALRDAHGDLATYTAYERFANPGALSLNAYGQGPFVRLLLGPLPHAPGVYAVTSGDEVKYVGIAVDLAERWGRRGYSVVDPRNCYRGGQATNCRVNNRIFQGLVAKEELKLSYLLTSSARAIEGELIRTLQPPWNIQGR